MSATIVPEEEMRAVAFSSLRYANGFFRTFQNSLNGNNSRFNEDLLYQLAVMSFEKYFVALLASYDWNATHHMPIALYKEAQPFEPELTDSMKQTAILVGKFEAICSLDGFGYRTPAIQELQEMALGMSEIKILVEKRLAEI
ncbi:MAG: hypothetical protein PHS30_00685 [Bacteroidales bacterium]|nr:hypothetical protein [Bacteroidales bacterium]